MTHSSKETSDCSAVSFFFIQDPAGCIFIVHKSNTMNGPFLKYEKI